ncbi:MAG: hypothetical protein HY931_01950 [Candidatus Falkowbacteria bacterium]|nr:MAG: hypothetical protein HY931_01950 [Candidatus Falkowbacteria bacterium]
MKKLLSFLFLSLITFSIFVAIPVLADNTPSCPSGSGTCLTNPLGTIETPQALIGKIINTVLGVVGSIALLMFVYGGITWMTSSGSADKVKKGRDTIVWSAIGLAIIFSAYGLVRVLIEGIKK